MTDVVVAVVPSRRRDGGRRLRRRRAFDDGLFSPSIVVAPSPSSSPSSSPSRDDRRRGAAAAPERRRRRPRRRPLLLRSVAAAVAAAAAVSASSAGRRAVAFAPAGRPPVVLPPARTAPPPPPSRPSSSATGGGRGRRFTRRRATRPPRSAVDDDDDDDSIEDFFDDDDAVDDEEGEEEEEEIEYGKFEIAAGFDDDDDDDRDGGRASSSSSSGALPPLPDYPDDDDDDDGSFFGEDEGCLRPLVVSEPLPPSGGTPPRGPPPPAPPVAAAVVDDELKSKIDEQQRQIDLLMDLVRGGRGGEGSVAAAAASGEEERPPPPPRGAVAVSTPPLPPLPSDEREGRFLGTPPLLSGPREAAPTAASAPPTLNVAPLKAMLFIDGTWLYYSLYERNESECPIVKAYKRNWHNYYRFDWAALPGVVCEQLQIQATDQGWSSSPEHPNASSSSSIATARPVEIVRASVFTSYKKNTDPLSVRVRMFEEMKNSNYDVHAMETIGKGEKCVDIQLAVEMLHYATVPDAYDVAILLSGDKDFIPAMARTRQKGRKVAIVSMRRGCNRALHETPNVKDYDVVWIEDHLSRLIVPVASQRELERRRIADELASSSPFTVSKVVHDFVERSGGGRVSSRDVGRHLKLLTFTADTNDEDDDGEEDEGGGGGGGGASFTLLEVLKRVHGGLRSFLTDVAPPGVFRVVDRDASDARGRDPRDKSFWIEILPGSEDVLLRFAKDTEFTSAERDFWKNYSPELFEREGSYYHTREDPGDASRSFYTPRSVRRRPPSLVGDDGGGGAKDEEEAVVDYSQFTVAKLKERCRERGLPVSGTKAVLLQRVTDDLEADLHRRREEEEESKRRTRNPSSTPTTGRGVDCGSGAGGGRGAPAVAAVDPAVTRHLEGLIREYVLARGGRAGSRDVGRYLSANASSDARSGDDARGGRGGGGARRIDRSALQELKEHYGTLATFVLDRGDAFVKHREGPDQYGDQYGFPITLRR